MITRLLKELFGHLYGVRDDYNPHGVQVEAGKVKHFSGKMICDYFLDRMCSILYLQSCIFARFMF